MRRSITAETGQNLLEFALILPIILLLVLALAEFGRIVLIYSEVSNASREAARFGASVAPGGPDAAPGDWLHTRQGRTSLFP